MVRSYFIRMSVASAILVTAACRSQSANTEATALAVDDGVPYVDQVPQILSQATLAKYKSALPKVAFGKLQAILEDPDTFWYDHETMPSAYQDTVAPDVTVGCRRNSAGASLIDIIPGGRQIFSRDGKTFNFPFGHTAGTDNSTNAYVVDFMWLPIVNGKRLPVAYYIKTGNRGGSGLRQWRWIFPKGTVFGEMIFIKDQSGELFPTELRTRERFATGWATNAYRPYTTAASLAAAIEKQRPDWASNETLSAAVEHLGDRHTLSTKSVRSPVFPGVFEQEGALDVIPDLGDAALIKSLLKDKTFVSSYGAVWKESGETKAFAASSAADFSIVPKNYEAGIIEVRDQSCQRCHKDAQRAIQDFNSSAVLYGDIWGSDQIFSFHVFDPDRCRGANSDNRSVRPVFQSSGLVQRYDASVHVPAYYKELP